MSEREEHIKSIVAALPDTPGVYQYLDENGKIIYVGKAKNLKRRVSSYFNKTAQNVKTAILVKKIHNIKYIVVKSESDALLLENNLIKKYQPRYNVLLKDGKTYPWLCITKEPFPRVFKTRQVFKGAEYYGPYSSVWVLETMLDLIRSIYPIRRCKLRLNEEDIAKGKFKLCLQYHIHNCLGCCEGLQSKNDYDRMIAEIRQIAKGNSRELARILLNEMERLATELRFEEAQAIKEKYLAIEQYREKTVITTTKDDNIDVFGYTEDENIAFVNILHITEGAISQGFTIEYHKKMDESKEELLSMAILELRDRIGSNAKEVIVPFEPYMEIEGVNFILPQKGDKHKLLELSEANARQYKLDRLKRGEKLNPEQRSTRILKNLQEFLKLDKIPAHIECFDNSNISGSDAVAGCVVFKMGKPSKNDYRKYNIKTVVGPDDYASMKEVVFRRYKRLVDEGAPLPDLIIADGGKGQMESIRQAVEDELGLKIPIAGLAKNSKHQTNELLFGFPPKSVGLKPNDPVFKFLGTIQNEVHRYAIGFHRDKRSKSQTHSELDEIKGIGPKTRDELLSSFKSVKRIKNASLEELGKIIGTSRASIIYKHFHGILKP